MNSPVPVLIEVARAEVGQGSSSVRKRIRISGCSLRRGMIVASSHSYSSLRGKVAVALGV